MRNAILGNDLNSVSIHVSGYTTAVRSAAIYYSRRTKGFVALVKIFFALNAQSYHFSCSSNERMTN